MDTLEKEIKNFINQERRASGLGMRDSALYPTETDFYLFLTDQLEGRDLEKMLNHLKTYPEDQLVVLTARRLFLQMSEAEKEAVPPGLLNRIRSGIPSKQSVDCPHCHRAITPFKKPLSRQKLLNLLWLAAGITLFSLSFFNRRFFIQWVVMGALCIAKWIVDQKTTKTQIMIYKALSEDVPPKPGRFDLEDAKKNRDAGI